MNDTKAFVNHMKDKLNLLLDEIYNSEPYLSIVNPETPLSLVMSIMKEIHLEIYHYQPHTTEAVFTAVGRMPKHDEQLLKDMILQQIEEVTHADMSLRDYIRLGGSKEHADKTRMSPESLAVSAVKRFLAEQENPICYLGFMYIFEAITMEVTKSVLPALTNIGFPEESREFIDLHAIEDIRHTDVILDIIERVVDEYPGADEAIEYGFDCFAYVYPLPVWQGAYRRALEAEKVSV